MTALFAATQCTSAGYSHGIGPQLQVRKINYNLESVRAISHKPKCSVEYDDTRDDGLWSSRYVDVHPPSSHAQCNAHL